MESTSDPVLSWIHLIDRKPLSRKWWHWPDLRRRPPVSNLGPSRPRPGRAPAAAATFCLSWLPAEQPVCSHWLCSDMERKVETNDDHRLESFGFFNQQIKVVANLQYASAYAVWVVMQEEGGEPECFTQPVHHIHFQFCTRWARGLFKTSTDNIIYQDVSSLLWCCVACALTQVNPTQLMASASMSPSIEGHEVRLG